jgi:Fe-S oxidoreductase
MGKFNYGAYFGPIKPLADALRESPARFWEPTPEQLSQPHDYVLHLGCNVLRTTHLAESLVAVFQAMGVDFITLGGPAHCCGVVHHTVGDGEAGLRVGQGTLNRFARIRPKAVLVYCPTCNVVFDDKLAAGALSFDLPYQHVSQFLAENRDRIPFKKPLRRRIGLHMHLGTDRARADSENTLAVLRAVPGLEVVELPANEDWGYVCSPKVMAGVGAERHHAMVVAMAETAKGLGCDGIATVYHTCYRELLHGEREFGLEWLNYAEVLAQALEAGPFPPRYKEFAQSADPKAAYAALAERALDRGGDPEKLRQAVDVHFCPGAAPVDVTKL